MLQRKMVYAYVIVTIFFLVCGVTSAPRVEFPGRHNMVNVTAFGANGNDQNSDQSAIVAAIGAAGNYPNPRIIYFPAGTYILEGTINMYGTATCTADQCGCCVTFQGQGPEYTVLKLKDGAAGFGNPSSPRAFILTPPGNMSYQYNLYDLKIEIGVNNNGAMALDWNVNNQGVIEDVWIESKDGNAFVGLEMTRAWPGPCLAKNVVIDGFQYGIRVAQNQYAPTFTNITLRNQKIAGWLNNGNILNIAKVTSINTVPTFSQSSGVTVLIDGDFRTPSGQSSSGAIEVNGGFLYARNITTTGYATALKKSGVSVGETSLTEYCTQSQHFTLFGDAWGGLKLEMKYAPDFHESDTNKWVCALDHQIVVNGISYPGLQAALDYAAANGKTTVYYPQRGQVPYPIHNGPITIPPQVRKITGFYSHMKPPGSETTHIDVVGSGEPLIIECMRFRQTTLHLQCSRTVVIKDCEIDSIINDPGCGDLFIENMSPIVFLKNPQRVWIKQFNPERMLVSGAEAWKKLRLEAWGGQISVLGLKSEGAGTLLTARRGASIELLGCFALPVDNFNAEMAATPAFICDESCMSLIYVLAGGYTIDVRETRGGITRDLNRSQIGGNVPFFVANKGCPFTRTMEPEPPPAAKLGDGGIPLRRRTSLQVGQNLFLPAQATWVRVFTPEGRIAWEYHRSASGQSIAISIPRTVTARGIAVVAYGEEQ